MGKRPINRWAIAALVLAGVPILDVILAIVALLKLRRSGERGRWLAIVVLVLSAGWTGATILFGYQALSAKVESVHAADLKVGDCIMDVPNGAVPDPVKRTRCDQPHLGEVFAVGANAEACGPQFFNYAPHAPEGPTFRVATADHGDGSIVCVAVSQHESWTSIRETRR